MAPHRVEHLCEGEGPHCDDAGAQHFEAGLLVEGDQEVLAHEHGTADVGQAAEVLQVAPHQDGAFSLLAEGPVDSQDVDVDCGPVRLVESQGVLERRSKMRDVRTSKSLFKQPAGLPWEHQFPQRYTAHALLTLIGWLVCFFSVSIGFML